MTVAESDELLSATPILSIMKKFCLLLFAISVSAVLSAQNIVKSLESNVPGEGRVVIYQDPAIGALLGVAPKFEGNESHRVLKSSGYRVQVYAGSNSRVARNEATQVGERVKGYFPEVNVYTFFASPRWLTRIGDFRSIEEADAMMRKLKSTGIFKEVAIVKDNINIQL